MVKSQLDPVSAAGRPIIKIAKAETSTALFLAQLQISIKFEMSTSKREIDEVSAVNRRSKKKVVEITTVPGSLEKRTGSVLNTRPAPASGSKPNVKIIGKIIKAENKETRTVIDATIAPVLGMSSDDFI